MLPSGCDLLLAATCSAHGCSRRLPSTSQVVKGAAQCSPALITEAEREVLRTKKGNTPSLMLQMWAMRAAREGYKKARVEAPIYGQLQGSVLELRRCCAFITNNLALPIPFPYYHMLVTLMMINFSLYSVSPICNTTVMTNFTVCSVTPKSSSAGDMFCYLGRTAGGLPRAALVDHAVHHVPRVLDRHGRA